MKLLESLYKQGIKNTKAIMKSYLERGPVKVTFRKNSSYRVGGFPIKKVGRSVVYYGINELKAMLWLEFRDDVVCFMEQPMEIEWIDSHIYTPDLLILLRDGRLEVWDPKADFFYDDHFKGKETFVREKLGKYCVDFSVMTEDKLPSKTLYENFGLMLQYRSYPIEDHIGLLSRWPSDESLTFDAICNGELGKPFDLGVIVRMVGHGYLSLILNEKIEGDTFISLGDVDIAC